MPYKNGKVYHETADGKNYGASNLDVAKALNTTTLDVAKLCQHSNINMWAMFKPMPHDTPLPYSDAVRRNKSWGLEPFVGSARVIPTEVLGVWAAAPQWSYPGASGWYVLDDFVSENEGMGYAPSAPPVVRSVMGVSGKKLNVTLYFEGNYANGGIPPLAMIIPNVTAGDLTMADLYPGVVIFKRVEGGAVAYTPERIITQNNKIGTNTTRVDMSYSFGSLGTGEFVAFPILSKTAYIGGSALSGVVEQVCFVHGGIKVFDTYDGWVGTELFTRRDVDEYYFKLGPQSLQPDRVSESNPPRYYFQFQTSGTKSLSLIPQVNLISKWSSDQRITITMSLIADKDGTYGFGDFDPITSRKDHNGNIEDINNQTTFNLLYKDYRYALCAWVDGDGDTVQLVLWFKPYSGSFADGTWNMTFLRGLALIYDGASKVEWEDVGPNPDGWTTVKIEKSVPNGNIAVKNEGIRKIRFGNTVADEGPNSNYRNGMYFTLYGSGNNFIDLNFPSTKSQVAIDCQGSDREIIFNWHSENDLITSDMPVTTLIYIDITADTQNTVQDLT